MHLSPTLIAERGRYTTLADVTLSRPGGRRLAVLLAAAATPSSRISSTTVFLAHLPPGFAEFGGDPGNPQGIPSAHGPNDHPCITLLCRACERHGASAVVSH